MAEIINLGPVGFNPTGNYDNTRSYEKLDMVLYQGSSYVAKQSVIGQLPTNSQYWDCVATGTLKQFTYASVAEMKLDPSLEDGMYAQTVGYYNANDGGGATYKITDEESESEYQEELDSGLYATLIIEGEVSVKQLGAKGDNTHDDTTSIQTALDKFKNVFIPTGIYKVTQITINQHQFLHGVGRSSVIYSTQDNTNNDIFAIIIPATSDRVIIKDLRLNGGIDNATTGTASEQDVNNCFENITCSTGYGFKVHHRGNVLRNIKCGGTKYGFDITGTDNVLDNCVSATTDSHGFFIRGANNEITNSKAFIAGNKSYGVGFIITHSFNRLVNCESQQNKYENFFLQNVYSSTVQGCISDGAFYNNSVATYSNPNLNATINSSSIFLHNVVNCIIDISNVNGSFNTNPTEVLGFIYHDLLRKNVLNITSYNRYESLVNVLSTKNLYQLCASNTCSFNGLDFNAFTSYQTYVNEFDFVYTANTQAGKRNDIVIPADSQYVSISTQKIDDKTQLSAFWVDCACVLDNNGTESTQITSQYGLDANKNIGIDIKAFLATKTYTSVKRIVLRFMATNKTGQDAFTYKMYDITASATNGNLPTTF